MKKNPNEPRTICIKTRMHWASEMALREYITKIMGQSATVKWRGSNYSAADIAYKLWTYRSSYDYPFWIVNLHRYGPGGHRMQYSSYDDGEYYTNLDEFDKNFGRGGMDRRKYALLSQS